ALHATVLGILHPETTSEPSSSSPSSSSSSSSSSSAQHTRTSPCLGLQRVEALGREVRQVLGDELGQRPQLLGLTKIANKKVRNPAKQQPRQPAHRPPNGRT